ncbi:YDG domain-containing protein [uncultured Adlercreutzia sp.]|uniref:YDG domain-containing protein n=1 Tax=uncultured Adlercreutzia sp. TaxID=875803 RepID=UPI002674F491|nr:YDG domain-containing protein [uncultured Adlercreutzia sp.]
MKHVMKRGRGAFGRLVLAAAMAVSVIGSTSVAGPCPERAWADEPTASAQAAGPALTIKAGPATPVAGQANTYSFPKLEVIASDPTRLIKGITVQFTSAITADDEIYFTDSGDFKVFNADKHGNKSVNNKDGASADQWRDYLRENLQIKLANETDTKSLRMIASFDPVTRTLDYNSLNGHYYEAVMGSIGWREAFAAASGYNYMGMQGYLVTITSKEENDFVYSLVGTDCWMGATCDNNYTKDYSGGASTANPSSHSVTYYWVTGPEAGQLLCTSDTTSHTHVAGTNPATKEPFFLNWNPVQPDCGGGTEYYMQFWTGDPSKPGSWNDLANTNAGYKVNYVVEYGGLEDDEDPDDTASGDANVDVFVKVDIDVDPTGKTITTEAYDVAVGDPLRVQENVNGDENVMTTVGGVQQPAEVKHTYQIKDPETGAWRDLRPDEMNEKGEPVHAGTYKVESSAVHTVKDDGTVESYKAGSDTFTIRPKAIDFSSDGVDSANPSDPSDPDGVVPRPFVKVYDGTDAFDASSISLADTALAGADVRVACDGARYSTVAAGETTVTLEGVSLAGADAADYTLAGVSDGDLTVPARILPRELVISASASVRWGLAGRPLADSSGAAVSFSSDEDVWSSGTWAANMLAPRDARRAVDGALESILGEAELACSRDGDGAALDADSPQTGTYTVAVRFANVNPLTAARGRSAVTMALAAARDGGSFDAITVKELGNGRYDIGNYLLTLRDAKLIVTDDPKGEDFSGIGDVIEETVDKKPVPGKEPLDKDDVEQIVGDAAGDKVPAGVKPSIVITKDGDEVDAIDPTKPGEYVIIATYPDPDGGEDKVVRVVYTVGEPDEGEVIVDDEVRIPLDPDADPLTKDDLKDAIDEDYGNRPDFPKTEPVITITRDGEEVDAVDPAVPGTYVVIATYIDEDGNVRIVRRTYVVAPLGEGGAGTGTSGAGEPAESPSGSDAGGASSDAAGKTRLRLAATGDDTAASALAASAVLSAAVALLTIGLRRRSRARG